MQSLDEDGDKVANYWSRKMNTHTEKKTKHWKAHFQAFCTQCCGGGKTLKTGNKTECEREATSHIAAYGHNVAILEV